MQFVLWSERIRAKPALLRCVIASELQPELKVRIPGETAMNKRTGLISAAAAVALVGWAAMAPAFARPPTVGVNPGYDRRLIESRKQRAAVDGAPVTTAPAGHRRHHRYRHD
jgi:hypothetical protein